jgi:hypothetical protein
MQAVDFSKEFKQFDGKVIPESPENPKNFTLRTAAINALLAPPQQGEPPLIGTEQVKRYDLASAIYAAKEPLDLEAEQVALIKEQIAKTYGPLITGQAWKMIEGQL